MTNDTKNIIVTGDHSGNKRRRSRKNQKGGGSTQGAIVQLNSTSSSSTASVPDGINPSKIVDTAAPIDSPTTFMHGGKKVVLKPKAKSNVVLSVSKVNTLKTLNEHKAKTKKSSKKILFSLKNLRNKLHKAKTIKKHSEENSFDDIKKTLEEAKLIKVGSKAPEPMIRQIYNDYMTLKHKAL